MRFGSRAEQELKRRMPDVALSRPLLPDRLSLPFHPQAYLQAQDGEEPRPEGQRPRTDLAHLLDGSRYRQEDRSQTLAEGPTKAWARRWQILPSPRPRLYSGAAAP